MTERGFITPPPGLLPEPQRQPEAAPRTDTERRAAPPVFFPAPPGATPSTTADPVAEGTDAGETASQPVIAAAPPAEPTVADQTVAAQAVAEQAVAEQTIAEAPEARPAEPVSAPAAGWTLELEGVPIGPLPDVLVLGRAPGSTVPGARALAVAGGGTVSKTHAIIRRDGDAVTIEDLGSTNGTAVIEAGERRVLTPHQPHRVETTAEIWLAQAHLLLHHS